jgi:hypothetical protein
LSAAPTVACRIATEHDAGPVLHAAAAGGYNISSIRPAAAPVQRATPVVLAARLA